MKFIKSCLEERTLAVIVLASGIFIGLGWPPVADALRPLTLPALFLVIVFSLAPFARLAASDLVSVDRDLLRVVLWQQIVLPTIAIAAGILARFPDQIILLMIVTACSGALFSSPALAEILGLDRRRALQAMVLSTAFMPVSLFLFLSTFRGIQTNLDILAYATRTFLFLVVPFALLAVYHPIARRLSDKLTDRIGLFSRWATIAALLVFGTGLMSTVSDKLDVNPSRVMFLLALATLLCLLMTVFTTIVMYRFGSREAFTAGIVAGFRNIGLGYALVGDGLTPDIAVYAGVSLIPVFIAPLVLRLTVTPATGALEPGAEEEMAGRH